MPHFDEPLPDSGEPKWIEGVAFTPDGRYRSEGALGGAFWHAISLCRFEPGELEPYLPLRVPENESLYSLPR